MTLEVGMTAEQSHTVTQEDLAVHWGGDVPVLASPVLMGLVEQTCMLATDSKLPEDHASVGMGFDIMHLAPTAEQEAVTLMATLKEINGKQLKFFVEARNSKGLISSGMHFRGIVNRQKFLEKIANRYASDSSGPEIGGFLADRASSHLAAI